jgi:lipopolysaccharide transport system permease protein
MAEHRSLVKFVVFPVQILPLTSLYVVAFSQVVGLAVVVLLATWLHGRPPPTLWLLLPAVALQIVFLAGVAWLLGALGAVLRDVKEVIQVALTVGMFLTPIFYLDRDVPRVLRLVIELNPLAHLIRIYRDALLGTGVTSPWSLPIFGVVAVATLLGGFLAFERTRSFLSDIL